MNTPFRQEKGMELLTDELRRIIPRVTNLGEPDPILWAKFFAQDCSWTWYVEQMTEIESDVIFYGYVQGYANEWGNFSLSELQTARGPLGLCLERDIHFTPTRYSEVKRETEKV